MLSPDTELLRVTVSDMNLARQAIADINLSSSHHRLAVDDAALHEFLSDTRHYLIVAICDGRSWAAFTVMRCAILIDASHSSSSTESMFACSTRTVEWEPHWSIDSSAKPDAKRRSKYGSLRITPTHQQWQCTSVPD
jgi:hypothetical protein